MGKSISPDQVGNYTAQRERPKRATLELWKQWDCQYVKVLKKIQIKTEGKIYLYEKRVRPMDYRVDIFKWPRNNEAIGSRLGEGRQELATQTG